MERGARSRKREREIACYGRDGPFARGCSKRRKDERGKLLELGIFTRPRLGQAKHVSPMPPISRFFRCRCHGIKSRESRSVKLILDTLGACADLFLSSA